MVVIRGAVVYPTLQNLSFLYDLLLFNLYSSLHLILISLPTPTVFCLLSNYRKGLQVKLTQFNALTTFYLSESTYGQLSSISFSPL